MVTFEGKSVKEFLKGFRSESTKETYQKKLLQFLNHIGVEPDQFLARTKKNPKWAERQIIDYVEARKEQVSGSTIRQLRDALKHFYEMNDMEDAVNWPKIVKMMPRAKKIGTDRSPTVEEVRKIIENSDLRTKCIVLIMCSGGVRVGAFDSFTWQDIEAITREGKVAAAKLTVYRGDADQYSTFVTPECYRALIEYRARRTAIGEVVAPQSPLIRDMWDNNPNRKRRNEDPAHARALSSKAIRNEMRTLLSEIGLRNGGKPEFKQVHGFRKFFKTNAERAMKTIDVEKLMGHAENYYKPSSEYLLDEYQKAIPYLTVSEAVELKNQLEQKIVVSDKKVGELERDNVALQDRLEKIEKDYIELKELVKARIQKSRGQS
ncbi:MAG: site-specific integrase [Thaumarchaeota archaeon]|nr:site-specific integrase [Nitrososphaerota archaeon]